MTLVLQLLLVSALLAQAAIAALRPGRPALAARLAAALPARTLPRAGLALLSLLAAALTLAGAFVPFAVFFAAILALLAALAGAWALARGGARALWPVPVLMAAAAVGMALVQPLGLKVLALPQADVLPVEPVPARVLKTYDAGVWFEGIAAGADGRLYLAANRGLDFARRDYWREAEGEVIVREPSGAERTLFRTPRGAAAGVPVVMDDGTVYMSSNGATPGIWRIAPDGRGTLFAPLPAGAWPNGLDLGPDGALYSPDSSLGRVWRIDPATGAARPVLQDERLRARPWIALAPGANGLHFRGRDMIVTVSDRTTVLAYPLQVDGSFGAPRELARGIPGDDFAVAADGSLYITTHPYDTLVKVAPDGRRSVVGTAAQHIVGATDAVFGRGPADRGTLYLVTDGGAFTGGPGTRGELVALQPDAAQSALKPPAAGS